MNNILKIATKSAFKEVLNKKCKPIVKGKVVAMVPVREDLFECRIKIFDHLPILTY